MNFSNRKQASRVALFVALGSSVFLSANSALADTKEDSGFYVGGGYGESRVNDSDFNDNNPASKLFAGLKFNNYIGIEGAINHYGTAEHAGYSSKLTGNTLALVGFLPLSDSFNIFIKGGKLWWRDEVTVLNTFHGTMSGDEKFYGVGMNFNLTEMISFRAEMERYNVKLSQSEIGVNVDGSSTVDVASVGILLRF